MDGKELARRIDTANSAAMLDSVEWQAMVGEHLLERAILYLRNESFPDIKGERYVETMSAAFAEFITDCWREAQ